MREASHPAHMSHKLARDPSQLLLTSLQYRLGSIDDASIPIHHFINSPFHHFTNSPFPQALYDRLFTWIVGQVNAAIDPSKREVRVYHTIQTITFHSIITRGIARYASLSLRSGSKTWQTDGQTHIGGWVDDVTNRRTMAHSIKIVTHERTDGRTDRLTECCFLR